MPTPHPSEAAGGKTWATNKVEQHNTTALDHSHAARHAAAVAAELTALTEFIIGRDQRFAERTKTPTRRPSVNFSVIYGRIP